MHQPSGETVPSTVLQEEGVRTARNCHNAAPLLDLEQSANWDKERGQDKAKPDTSAIMQPIAHSLNDAQIRAVAAYLSYLE
jgi:hypothetical protein